MLCFVQKGSTALIRAVMFKRDEVVKILVISGADVNVKTNVNFSQTCFSVFVMACCQNGETALFLVTERRNVELVQLMLNNGANINDNDVVCVFVSLNAILRKYNLLLLLFVFPSLGLFSIFFLQFLPVEVCCRVFCCVQGGCSALIKAVRYQDTKIVETLLKAGASPNFAIKV